MNIPQPTTETGYIDTHGNIHKTCEEAFRANAEHALIQIYKEYSIYGQIQQYSDFRTLIEKQAEAIIQIARALKKE